MIFSKSWKDIFPISYALACIIIPLLIASDMLSPWMFVMQAILMVIVSDTSLHYHMHLPVFRNAHANTAYKYILSVAVGVPADLWKWFHNLHHKYNNDKPINGQVNDPVSMYRYSKTDDYDSVWAYGFRGALNAVINRSDNTCRQSVDPDDISTIRNQRFTFYAYIILLLLINWPVGLVYTFTWYASLALNLMNSYGEHYKPTEPNNPRADAVSSYNRLLNIICFNVGHHQEHHFRPGVHWTQLPSLTHMLPRNRKIIGGAYIWNTPIKHIISIK